jgi:hypothetical protein
VSEILLYDELTRYSCMISLMRSCIHNQQHVFVACVIIVTGPLKRYPSIDTYTCVHVYRNISACIECYLLITLITFTL